MPDEITSLVQGAVCSGQRRDWAERDAEQMYGMGAGWLDIPGVVGVNVDLAGEHGVAHMDHTWVQVGTGYTFRAVGEEVAEGDRRVRAGWAWVDNIDTPVFQLSWGFRAGADMLEADAIVLLRGRVRERSLR